MTSASSTELAAAPSVERPESSVLGGALYAGVLLLVLWAPLPFGSVEPWAVGLLRVGAFLLASIWAVWGAARGAFVVDANPLQAVLFAAAALGFLQTLPLAGGPASVDVFDTRQAATTILAFAIFFSISLVALDRPARVRRAAWILFWWAFALSVFAIVQSLAQADRIYWFREASSAFFGPFVNKNHFAGLMELLLPLGLGPLAVGAVSRDRRVLVAFAAVIVASALVLSRSRGGMVSLAAELVALGAFGWSARSRARATGRIAAAAGAAALVVAMAISIFWIGADSVSEAVAQTATDAASTSDVSRYGIWRDTAALVREHPLLGTGIGAFGTAFPKYSRWSGNSAVLHAHNDYLQVAADSGIVGTVLAILFLFGLGLTMLKGLNGTDPLLIGVLAGAASGCLGLLVHSFVDFNLQIPSNALAFLFVAALAVRSSALARTRAARSSRERSATA